MLVHNFDNQMVSRLPYPNVLVKSFPQVPPPPPSQLLLFHLEPPTHLGENPSCRVISRVNKPRSPVPCNTPARSAGRSSFFAPWKRRATRLPKAPRTGEQSWRCSAWRFGWISGWHLLSIQAPKEERKAGEGCFSHEIHEMTGFFVGRYLIKMNWRP